MNSRNIVRCCTMLVALWTSSPALVEAVVVSNVTELSDAIYNAHHGGDKTILIEAGTYALNDMLVVTTDDVSVNSVSGDRDSVVIKGNGMAGGVTHVFNVAADRFSVQNVTLRDVSNHAVQFHPGVKSPVIRNVHILDTGEQMVKIAYDPAQMDLTADDGVMENCLLEYSADIGPQWYIGGIDAHNAKNWIVRDNVFKYIRSPSLALAEHAVHFWSDSRNTLVERNLIINCDRGIGFGLGDRGHLNGIIRNNMIYHDENDPTGFADVGIGLESAAGAQVYNNTIYMEHGYPNAIEYRFTATTGVLIANNLTNRLIQQRDGGQATLSNNVTNAEFDWFQDVGQGDLHLAGAVDEAVDQGQVLAGLTDDFDKENRPAGGGMDIGADEYAVDGPGGLDQNARAVLLAVLCLLAGVP
ncbi:MAG: right-handed parallel beta-helix repeat-containing protein [Deltaproteobacteria bacterium]|nr:right-handed parallel beta-helix repeat-containing protein [Deltaproteobacteria bacterium]